MHVSNLFLCFARVLEIDGIQWSPTHEGPNTTSAIKPTKTATITAAAITIATITTRNRRSVPHGYVDLSRNPANWAAGPVVLGRCRVRVTDWRSVAGVHGCWGREGGKPFTQHAAGGDGPGPRAGCRRWPNTNYIVNILNILLLLSQYESCSLLQRLLIIVPCSYFTITTWIRLQYNGWRCLGNRTNSYTYFLLFSEFCPSRE